MKPESKLWQLLKQKTSQISWTRLESWTSFGTPDCLGYNDSCGFFMCELKIIRGHKVSFSPHQKLFHITRPKRNFILVQQAANGSRSSVKLYGSSAIHGLIEDIRETPALAVDDWNHIQRIFLGLRPNWAWALSTNRAEFSACSLPAWSLAGPPSAWALGILSLARHPLGGLCSSFIFFINLLSLMFAINYSLHASVPALSTALALIALLRRWTCHRAVLRGHAWRIGPPAGAPDLVIHMIG